jgi:hypothetical protein
MHAVERRFLKMRQGPPDLRGAMSRAFAHVGADVADTDIRVARLYRAGLAVAAAVDGEVARALAAGKQELAYHNRHHFAEATLAMGWLCAIARERGAISLHQAVLGVVAMVGHDFRHDGSWTQTGALEKIAAEGVAGIAADAGVDDEDQLGLHAIILATAMPAVRANKIRAEELDRLGFAQSGLDAVCLMASEADVLTSLMPGLGCRLGYALAAEWAMQPGKPPMDPSSFAGRVAFLRLHDYLSDAAVELGLSRMHVNQFMAFRRFAMRSGGEPEPEAGAALLDRLPLRQAARAFAGMMLQTACKQLQPGQPNR